MKTKTPSLISILILTLITTLAWVSLSIYRAVTSKPSPVVPEKISRKLDPTLKKDVIESLKGKLYPLP